MDANIFFSFFYSKEFLLAFFTTLSVATLLTWFILNSKRFNQFLDIPGQRSLHVAPIPSLGGLAIMASITFSAALYSPELLYLLPFLLVLITLSFLDDLITIKPLIRLAVHFLTTLTFLFTEQLSIFYYFIVFSCLGNKFV